MRTTRRYKTEMILQGIFEYARAQHDIIAIWNILAVIEEELGADYRQRYFGLLYAVEQSFISHAPRHEPHIA